MKTNDPSWFESWFDSPYYHILYKKRDQEEANLFLSGLTNHLGLKDHSAWDMACGRGRHALYLASIGVDVIGSDLSESSIQAASKFERDNLSFFVHDMRLPIRINYFDVVLNLFTSFGYFERERDNQLVMEAAFKALRKGGCFVLDYFNPDHVRRVLKPEEQKVEEGIIFNISKKIIGDKVQKHISFEAEGTMHHFNENVRLYDRETLNSLFEKTGFRVTDYFGNYMLQEFDPASSERLIVIGEKK